jgi:hypothetical protein
LLWRCAVRSRRKQDSVSSDVDTLDRAWRLKQGFEIERQDFIRQEIDLVRIFLEIADRSSTDEASKRNLVHARRAYDSVLELLRNSSITPAGRAEIEPELRRLKVRIDRAADPT